MKILALDDFAPRLISAEGQRMGQGRGLGIHLGDCLAYLERYGLGKTYNQISGELSTNFMMFGFVFERMLETTWTDYLGVGAAGEVVDAGLITRVGEQEKDGVFMNLDFLIHQNKTRGIEREVVDGKVTWRTMRKLYLGNAWTQEFVTWVWQLMAYCHAVSATHGCLIIAFMNGDYGKLRGPRCRRVRFRFREEELVANWAKIRQAADYLRRTPSELEKIRGRKKELEERAEGDEVRAKRNWDWSE